ncbi:MAG: redox-regulated ATPase YchF [Chloroflexota bacterium]
MKLGIIGLPQSGKTTIFNTLTRGNRPTTISGGRFNVYTAVVDVPDGRIDRLRGIFRPQKVTYAKVTYADIAGLEGGAGREGITGLLLNQLAQMDGFVHIVRSFIDERVPHPSGSVDPLRDIAAMDTDLLINDLLTIERRLERLDEEWRKGARDKKVIEREKALFQRLNESLSKEVPLRDIPFSLEEEKLLSGFGLLTNKPVLIVLNLGEGQEPPDMEYSHGHSQVVALQGKLEMEIVQLSLEDAKLFMEEYGIEELGLNRIIRLSYDLLGLQSFFTYESQEVRAWTVRRGATAPEAAGVIHTDMQTGFIRAEVISFEELVALGSISEARSKGRLRLEGKDYVVQDGDVITIRFNV